ncbi:MAG: cob(I)yrinic acid a,c-diamide adenosyltransferase [Syntrophorhabdales bacterium]|jgi:cob(I)alamin adenosyltransferase
MRRGYVQVYTGNGKGKTTAALGLALRAAGAGLKVFIAQFVKKEKCSEHRMLERLGDMIVYRQYGQGMITNHKVDGADIDAAREGMREIEGLVQTGSYDVVILDEVNVAVHFGLVGVDEVLGLIRNKPAGVELILTGRYAPESVIAEADLVTEMREVKHYYQRGVNARTGIEK